jgi:G3E family GTPase
MREMNRLPVVVLTGFLGSGKTTLLNRLLRDGPRAAVLINEFGTTPVDQHFIESEELPLMTLAGGCLCCQVRSSLAPVLKNIRMAWGKPGAPEFGRVIIETSGVASPEPVLDTLLRDRWLEARYQLDAVIATLAVPSALDTLARFPEAEAQVAWADALVLTQTDLADAATLARVEARLAELAPTIPKLRALWGELELSDLPAPVAYRRVPDGTIGPDHGFYSVSLNLLGHIPWARLESILNQLLSRHPSLVRVKGIVYLPDRFEPVAVHGASGRLYPPVILPARASADHRSRLVLITDGPVSWLAEELVAALGGNVEPNAVRLH